jgi:hypothetical protein
MGQQLSHSKGCMFVSVVFYLMDKSLGQAFFDKIQQGDGVRDQQPSCHAIGYGIVTGIVVAKPGKLVKAIEAGDELTGAKLFGASRAKWREYQIKYIFPKVFQGHRGLSFDKKKRPSCKARQTHQNKTKNQL